MIPISHGRHGEIFAVTTRQAQDEAIEDSHSAHKSDKRIDNDPSLQVDRRPHPTPGSVTVTSDRGSSSSRKGWRAVKLVYAPEGGWSEGARPHNVVNEVVLMKRMEHENIVPILDYTYDPISSAHRLEMPLYACTLADVFADDSSPSPSPFSFPRILPEALVYSLLTAVDYIHTIDPPIAHRDVKPSNVLLDWDGTLKLGDFGTAFGLSGAQSKSRSTPDHGARDDAGKQSVEDGYGGSGPARVRARESGAVGRPHEDDVAWIEGRGSMCCDIGTGSYRAPELLFSDPDYDPFAIDLWAMGCVIAQFFRPQVYDSGPECDVDPDSPSSSSSSPCGSRDDLGHSSNASASDEHESDCDPLEDGHGLPRSRSWDEDIHAPELEGQEEEEGEGESGTRRHRVSETRRRGPKKPLFDASFGSLGLAASIFRVLGAPSEENWPGYGLLPDAGKMEFPNATPRPLRTRLPGLSEIGARAREPVVQVVEGLLRLDPSKRMSAAVARRRWSDLVPALESLVYSEEEGTGQAPYTEGLRMYLEEIAGEKYRHLLI